MLCPRMNAEQPRRWFPPQLSQRPNVATRSHEIPECSAEATSPEWMSCAHLLDRRPEVVVAIGDGTANFDSSGTNDYSRQGPDFRRPGT